jgi:hypothetical protein
MIGRAKAIDNDHLKWFEVTRLVAAVGVTLCTAAQTVPRNRDHVAGDIVERVASERRLQARPGHFVAQGLPLIAAPSCNQALSS